MLSEMNLEIQRLDKNIYSKFVWNIFSYHLLDIRYLQPLLLVLTTQYEDNRDIDWSAGLSYAEGCVVARPWQCRALPSLHHPQCADPAQLSRTSPASTISPCHHWQQPPGLYTLVIHVMSWLQRIWIKIPLVRNCDACPCLHQPPVNSISQSIVGKVKAKGEWKSLSESYSVTSKQEV